MGRQTQHRPSRESEAREKADLKRENRALRRQLTRMRRQLQKAIEIQMANQVEAAIKAEEERITEAGCESCGAPPHHITRIKVPSGTLVVCRDCKHRKKEVKS